jgi:transposase-like protein
VRDEGTVRNKAVYVALGVRPDGSKEILGLWIEQSEGAKFWLRVMNEVKSRGVEDVLMAIVDGLKGLTLTRPLTRTRKPSPPFFRRLLSRPALFT